MILKGYSIEEAYIENISIASIAYKTYLYVKFTINPNKNLKLPVYYFPPEDRDNLTKIVCEIFDAKSFSSISNKKVYILTSNDNILLMINPENFKIFSPSSRYRLEEHWVQEVIMKHPDIATSSFPLEQKANISFIKGCLSQLEKPNELNKQILNNINHLILKNKLEENLDIKDNNYKKFKI